jgi:hypothetical protein
MQARSDVSACQVLAPGGRRPSARARPPVPVRQRPGVSPSHRRVTSAVGAVSQMPTGALYTSSETLDLQGAWDESTAHHPGIAVIGGDGGREHLVLGLRRDPSPVLLADVTSEGRDSAIRQAGDVARFIEGIESGTFAFTGE